MLRPTEKLILTLLALYLFLSLFVILRSPYLTVRERLRNRGNILPPMGGAFGIR